MFSCSITRLPAYFTAPSSLRPPLSLSIHRSFLSSRLSLSLFVKRKTFADFHRANCESNVASYNSITPHRRDGKKEEARDEQGTGKRVREGKESRAPSSIIGRRIGGEGFLFFLFLLSILFLSFSSFFFYFFLSHPRKRIRRSSGLRIRSGVVILKKEASFFCFLIVF